MTNLCIFGDSFFKIRIADILNFQWIKYLGKGLSYFKNWEIGINYCWNYGPSKLLLHFIKYCLDQLNNKHKKIAVNHLLMANIFKLHQYQAFRLMKMCDIIIIIIIIIVVAVAVVVIIIISIIIIIIFIIIVIIIIIFLYLNSVKICKPYIR